MDWFKWLVGNMDPEFLKDMRDWLDRADASDMMMLVNKIDSHIACGPKPKIRPEDAEELVSTLIKPNGAVATVWRDKPVPEWIYRALVLGYEPEVLRSAAGYYIGALDRGEPYARYSVEYWKDRRDADKALINSTWTMRQNP